MKAVCSSPFALGMAPLSSLSCRRTPCSQLLNAREQLNRPLLLLSAGKESSFRLLRVCEGAWRTIELGRRRRRRRGECMVV